MAGIGVGDNTCREKKVSSDGIKVSSGQENEWKYGMDRSRQVRITIGFTSAMVGNIPRKRKKNKGQS